MFTYYQPTAFISAWQRNHFATHKPVHQENSITAVIRETFVFTTNVSDPIKLQKMSRKTRNVVSLHGNTMEANAVRSLVQTDEIGLLLPFSLFRLVSLEHFFCLRPRPYSKHRHNSPSMAFVSIASFASRNVVNWKREKPIWITERRNKRYGNVFCPHSHHR